MRIEILLVALTLVANVANGGETKPLAPTAVPDLVCFWDFQEETGAPRIAKGPNAYALKDGAKTPVSRADGGVFGPFAAKFDEGQWLNLPRADAPALNIFGKTAQVTVVAWVKRAKKSTRECEAVAGMWNETLKLRQYCLFLNLGLDKSRDQVGGHISSVGGPTPGNKYCIDASIGATAVKLGEWHCAAFTYDGKEMRSYLDGAFDARPKRNPYPYDTGIFDGGEKGADFTVGSVFRHGEMGNWFVGEIGGVAVYKRALTDEELAGLAANKGK